MTTTSLSYSTPHYSSQPSSPSLATSITPTASIMTSRSPLDAVSPRSGQHYTTHPRGSDEYATGPPTLPPLPDNTAMMGHGVEKHSGYYSSPVSHNSPYLPQNLPPPPPPPNDTSSFMHYARPREHPHAHSHPHPPHVSHSHHRDEHHMPEALRHPHEVATHPPPPRHEPTHRHTVYEHPPYHHGPPPAQPLHGQPYAYHPETDLGVHSRSHDGVKPPPAQPPPHAMETLHPPPGGHPYERGSNLHMHDAAAGRHTTSHQAVTHAPMHGHPAPVGAEANTIFHVEESHGVTGSNEFGLSYNTFRVSSQAARSRASSYALPSTQPGFNVERPPGIPVEPVPPGNSFAALVPAKRTASNMVQGHDLAIDRSTGAREPDYAHNVPDKPMNAVPLLPLHQPPPPQSSSAARRAAQNRAAQRAFRQRKERYVKELEYKARILTQAQLRLRERREQMKQLRRFARHLQRENEQLRARIEACQCAKDTVQQDESNTKTDDQEECDVMFTNPEFVDNLLKDEPDNIDEDIIHPPPPVLPFPELDPNNSGSGSNTNNSGNIIISNVGGKDANTDRRKSTHPSNATDTPHN